VDLARKAVTDFLINKLATIFDIMMASGPLTSMIDNFYQ
jgi:hypothetical protein